MFYHLVRTTALAIFVAGGLALSGAPPALAQSACGPTVTVQRGDTLSSIARRCGVTVSALLRANPQISNPSIIPLGGTIRISGRPGAGSGEPAAGRCGDSVIVRPGETLNRIAARCGTTLGRLLAANPQIRNPNIVAAGTRLRLPGGSPVTEPERPRPPQVEQYRVRPGDTFASIARRFDVPLARLLAANNDIDPRSLPVGAIVRIPGAGSGGGGGGGGDGGAPLTVTGTLTNEGITCLALRGDDGRLYTLAGDTEGFEPGDRVRVRGQRARASICQQGTTIEVRRIQDAEPDGDATVRVTGTLTNEGVECPALRGDDGRLYTLATRRLDFDPGDRVTVEGQPVEVSFCMQGRTITVDRIRAAR